MASPSLMRIAVLSNTARYIWNFRMNLVAALQAAGHDVVVICPDGPDLERVVERGVRHCAITLSPGGMRPRQEWNSVRQLRQVLRRLQIDIVLSSTPKGNLYTALARIGLGTRQIANVSGLGSGHLRQDWVTHVMEVLYRLTFPRIDAVLFENATDQAIFLQRGWCSQTRSEVIPGLGVDLDHFRPARPGLERTPARATCDFLMIARVIADKGVREFVDAGRAVRQDFGNVRLVLLGDQTSDNPTAIPAEELQEWIAAGVIEHRQHTDDVRPAIAAAGCVVLPSYREGMSRTLLEGAAMGRPLIASDVPGCREAVIDGDNGFLCKPQNAQSLAAAMLRFLRLPTHERERMAHRSRELAEQRFAESLVIERYLARIEQLASRG